MSNKTQPQVASLGRDALPSIGSNDAWLLALQVDSLNAKLNSAPVALLLGLPNPFARNLRTSKNKNKEKQVQQLSANNVTTTQQFEDELEKLKTITQKLNNDLKASEERNASAVEKLRQSEASKNTIVTGLQHENELLQQKVANLETLLHTERGLTSELRHDKDNLQKQLELVTLRLPAPKVGFWARLFGGGRKKEK